MGTVKQQTEQPVALDELIAQHIQRRLAEHGGNISAAARALRMHRRTLQRKLAKLRSAGADRAESAS